MEENKRGSIWGGGKNGNLRGPFLVGFMSERQKKKER